jgi:hypothetical protein
VTLDDRQCFSDYYTFTDVIRSDVDEPLVSEETHRAGDRTFGALIDGWQEFEELFRDAEHDAAFLIEAAAGEQFSTRQDHRQGGDGFNDWQCGVEFAHHKVVSERQGEVHRAQGFAIVDDIIDVVFDQFGGFIFVESG